MQRPLKLLIIGLVIVAAVVAWMMFKPGGENVVRDLVADAPSAKERRPTPEVFSVVNATLAGETLPAIEAKHGENSGTRIKWDVTVPNNAWFAFSLGIMEEAWNVAGDGVLFRVGVSDGAQYDELLSLVVNPNRNESDRKWIPLAVDLSPYAGKTVELILNTNASPPPAPGMPGTNDTKGDLALWGAPRIIVR